MKKGSKKTKKKDKILRGEKHPKWKGGISSVHHEIRKSEKYFEWKIYILDRDNYTCVQCGFKYKKYIEEDKGKYPLHVDHIISFSKIMEKMRFELGVLNIFENAMKYDLLWDTSNGRTLCISCHKKTESYCKG